jgi:pyrrolidone-carboxylate peptidase
MNSTSGSVTLIVKDLAGNLIGDAAIELKDAIGNLIEADCKMDSNSYNYQRLQNGTYSAAVSKDGFESGIANFSITPGQLASVVITLGTEGGLKLYRNGVRIPFATDINRFGVLCSTDAAKDSCQEYLDQNLINRNEATFDKTQRKWTLVFTFDAEQTDEEKVGHADNLLAIVDVICVGLLFSNRIEYPRIVTGTVIIQIHKGSDDAEAMALASSLGYITVRAMDATRNIIRIRKPSLINTDFPEELEQFNSLSSVKLVDTEVYDRPRERLTPSNFLFPEQAHLKWIQCEEAWQALHVFDPTKEYGDPTISIALNDTGVQSTTLGGATYATHPAFMGPMGSRTNKITHFYDFSNPAAADRHNNSPSSAHASLVAGLIAAPVNGASNEGTVGVIPSARLMSSMYPNFLIPTYQDFADASVFRWYAGLDANFISLGQGSGNLGIYTITNPPVNFKPFNAGGDTPPEILNNSWGYGYNEASGPDTTNAVQQTVRYGRNGRGLIIFFSAGNERNKNDEPGVPPINRGLVSSENSISIIPGIMAVAATSLDNLGVEEVIAGYSNFSTHAAKQIEFAAPGHDNYLVDGAGNYLVLDPGTNRERVRLHDPTNHIGIISTDVLHGTEEVQVPGSSAAHNVIGFGNMPGRPAPMETTLENTVPNGGTFIDVLDSDAYMPGQMLIIGDPFSSTADKEIVQIMSAPAPSSGEHSDVIPAYHRLLLASTISNSTGFSTGVEVAGFGLKNNATAYSNVDSDTHGLLDVDDANGFLTGHKVLVNFAVGGPDIINGEVFVITDVDTTSTQHTIKLDDKLTLGSYGTSSTIHVFGGTISTELKSIAVATSLSISVKSTHGFQKGQAVLIGASGDFGTSEARVILSVVTGNLINIEQVQAETLGVLVMKSLLNTHPANTPVVGGRASYYNAMGGTSAASPIISGVAGLILTAKPKLSWIEVREILRETAIPIDVTNNALGGGWQTNDTPTTNSVATGGSIIFDTGFPTATVNATGTGASIGATTIPITGTSTNFSRGQIVVFEPGSANEEIRVVGKILPGKLMVDPLRMAHTNGTTIQGGRVPHYSPYYGHGRVDAFYAVDRALAYSHNDRDLALRNYLYEDGTGTIVKDDAKSATVIATNPIHSPDIWLTNSNTPAANFLLGEDEHAPTESPASGIVNINFLGTGPDLNDLRVRGIYRETSTALYEIKVVTGGATVPNQIRWRKNGGVFAHLTDITGANQELELDDGLWISFGEALGHTDTNIWELNVEPVTDRYIYAQVHNIGDKLSNLDAWVRYYFAFSDGLASPGVTSPFHFPSQWSDSTLIETLPDTGVGVNQTYFIGNIDTNFLYANHETFIPAGEIGLNSRKIIQSGIWKAEYIPSTDPGFTKRPYLLAQVSPHDGALDGQGAEAANNISYREIAFVDIQFLDDTGAALGTSLEVDEFGSPVNQNFAIQLRSNVGKVNADRIEVEFIRLFEGNEVARAEYKNLTGSWVLDDGNGGSVNWVDITPPKLTHSTVLATGENFHITFSGDFDVNTTHDELLVRLTVNSSTVLPTQRVPIAIEEHKIIVAEQVVLPLGDEGSLGRTIFAKSHVFAHMTNLLQTSELAFGPVDDGTAGNMSEERNFRGTSLFTTSVPATPVKAFAVVNGFAMLQPGADAASVNLILRPFSQAVVGFTPVKYYVYRGLKKDNFINAGDNTLMIAENAGTNSEWLTYLYGEHNDLNPGDPFLSKAVGFDAPNQPAADTLQEYFFKSDLDNQLPFCERGIHLGDYNAAASPGFGFEIVLEDGDAITDLAFARTAQTLIDAGSLIDTPPADPMGLAFRRNQALTFVDPAAYYGLHMVNDGTLIIDNAGSKENKKALDIFTAVIDKFFTKNRTYIDIRNENGYQLNYYGNYDDGTGKQLEWGLTTGSLTAVSYNTFDWPILILEDADTLQNASNSFNGLLLKFYLKDGTNLLNNINPVLFVEQGLIDQTVLADNIVPSDDLIDTVADLSKEVKFKFPNTGMSATASSAAWHMKLHLTRRLEATTVWKNTIVQSKSYLDNIFGPVGKNPPWESSSDIQWTNVVENKLVDGESEIGVSNFVERGVAFEGDPGTGRVIFYTNTLQRLSSGTQNFAALGGTTGGSSDDESFFHVRQLFGKFNLNFDVINDGTTDITVLNLVEDVDANFNFFRRENYQILGLKRSELEMLDLLPGFSTNHEKTILLTSLGLTPDPNGVLYTKYTVGIQGIDAATGVYKHETPTGGSEICVFSKDGNFLCSKLFAAAEPLPTDYERNVEESIGTLAKHPKDTHAILSIAGGAQSEITVSNATALSHLELFTPDETITISGASTPANNGTWTIVKVFSSSTSTDTVIKVLASLTALGAPDGGELTYEELAWEDHFIALDEKTISGAPDKMRTLVDNFISAVGGVGDDGGAPAALNPIVSAAGIEIFNRAVALVDDTDLDYPDDRILYWARISMAVALKKHPWLVKNATASDQLAELFEQKSRGYDTFSFSGSGKKVLVFGFDPFDVNKKDGENIEQSNPSGVSALYLHGKLQGTIGTAGAVSIQSIILPVRFEDFDKGIIEEIVEPLLRANTVDMIVTVSQGREELYDVERFTTSYRGPWDDNHERARLPVRYYKPLSSSGVELLGDLSSLPKFLEGDLPIGSIIDNRTSTKVIFNQRWETYNGDERPLALEGDTKNVADGLPPTADQVVIEASGGHFLSNESFFRVAYMRETLDELATVNARTGHLHLPKLQSFTNPSFSAVDSKALVKIVVNIFKNAVDGL